MSVHAPPAMTTASAGSARTSSTDSSRTSTPYSFTAARRSAAHIDRPSTRAAAGWCSARTTSPSTGTIARASAALISVAPGARSATHSHAGTSLARVASWRIPQRAQPVSPLELRHELLVVLPGGAHEPDPVRVVALRRLGREDPRARVGGAARVGPVDEQRPHSPCGPARRPSQCRPARPRPPPPRSCARRHSDPAAATLGKYHK